MKRTTLTCIFILTGLSIVISYYFLDRSLAGLFASENRWLLRHIANDFTTLLFILAFLFYVYIGIKLLFTQLNHIDKKLLFLSQALVTSVFIKSCCKIIFGRYWINTFVCDNPSLLRDHVYGFHWFTNGAGYASFPSGHTMLMFTFAVSMSYVYPKWRVLYALLAIAVGIAQVAMNYHLK